MRVAVLAANDWRIDSRVVREAETLANNGYEVTVVFRRGDAPYGLAEEANGVRYLCVPRMQLRAWDVFPLLGIHLRVLALDARRLWHGPGRLSAVVSLFQLSLFPILAIGGLLTAPLALLATWRKWRPVLRVLEHPLQPLFYLNEYALRCRHLVASIAPHFVHAHDLVTQSCALLLRIEQRPARIIYDAHELETHTNYWALNRWTKYWVSRYEEVAIRSAKAVVTVCDSIADWLAHRYSTGRPTVVLNVPAVLGDVTPRRADMPRSDIRSVLHLPRGTPLAVYVGSVTIDRGLEICVQALPYLPGVHLALVGPRYKTTEESVTRLGRELAVQDRLHLVDAVPSDQVVEFISSADCSVIAVQNVCLSYYFAMPSKLFESVLAGLPIAAARLVEMERFVRENGIGVVMDETDPKDVARAIQELLCDREQYQPNKVKLERIAQKYGWPIQQRRLLTLYHGLRGGLSD